MLNSLKTMLGFSLLALIGVWMGCSSDTSPVASYSASKTHTAAQGDAGTTTPTETGSEDGLTDTGSEVVDIPDANLASAIRTALGLDSTSDITVSNLTSLRKLVARSQGIQNLAGLEHAVNLDTLHLASNSITSISPLAGLTKLTYLNLATNSIADLSPLAGLTELTELHLYKNGFTSISPLASLTKLKRLTIGANSFGGDLSPLAGLTELEWLKTNDAAVTDLSPLENLTKLVTLNISSNPGITDLSPLVCLLPTFKTLHLKSMPSILFRASMDLLYLASKGVTILSQHG